MAITMTLRDLRGLERCPQCSIANPNLTCVAQAYTNGRQWKMYRCNSCFEIVTAQSVDTLENIPSVTVEKLYPSSSHVASELPERAQKYLTQAINSLNSPDGSVMLAGSAVDAMLKAKGLDGDASVYTRIDKAVEDGILTQDMADWAHEVRLGSNRPRHSDDDDPHVTSEEARQAVEFAEMLGHILFVLPDRVAKGKARAEA